MRRGLLTEATLAGLLVLLDLQPTASAQEISRRQVSAEAQKAWDDGVYDVAERLIDAELAACEAAPRFADDCLDLMGESASVAIYAGHYDKAETRARAALVLARKVRGERDIATSDAWSNLGSALYYQGRYREALDATQKGLDLTIALLGERHSDTAVCYANLGVRLDALGRYEAAEAAHRKAIAIWNGAPEAEQDQAATRHNLAKNLDNQGRYEEGEVEYRAALAIDRRLLGADHPTTARTQASYGTNLNARGRYVEAEAEYRQALAAREARLGPDHPEVAHSLTVLAGNLGVQGREAEAEALGRRALAIRRAAGPQHIEVGYSLSDLAVGIERQGRAAEATPLFREAYAIFLEAKGADHSDTLTVSVGLAKNLAQTGRTREAETRLRDAVARGARLGAAHPDFARFRIALARFLLQQGRAAAAVPLFEAAIPPLAAAIGENHPDVIQSRALQGEALRRSGRIEAADDATAAAAEAAVGRLATLGGSGADQRRSISDFARLFTLRIDIDWDLSHRRGAAADDACAAACERAFAAAQWAINSSSAYAIDRVAAGMAEGSGPLAALERERSRLIFARDADDRRYAALGAGEDAQRQALSKARTEKTRAIEAIDAQVAARFPRYAELARPQAIGIAAVQQALRADEALLVAVPARDTGYVWAISRDRVRWYRRPELADARLTATVAGLRAALSPGSGGARGQSGRVVAGAFDRRRAAQLHAALVAPAEPLLAGKRRLISVSTGALSSLPLGTLPTGAGAGAPWLIDRFALATLPAPSTLARIRCAACRPPSHARGPVEFVGIGAPDMAAADPAGVRSGDWRSKLPALPFAARELETIGARFPGRALVLTGAAATEARLRSDPAVRGARLLTFATHSVRTGDMGQLGEPALLLSPAARAGGMSDDGLLTVSEAAQLDLAAELVALSACDTAAPDGSFQGDDFSGFARAFFSVGARALLVSHWAVNDESTAVLMTDLFARLPRDPGAGRAEALRAAMRGVRDTPGGRWAHPRYWAAFALIGDPD